jgi:hypothetical protein
VIQSIDLDHVAIAVERHTDAWPRYVGDLGGVWKSGGRGPGFAPAQVAFANGMRLEVLEPNLVEQNDFLRRFLDHSGPGPHHLTFKVGDFDQALAAVTDAGYHPIGIDRRDPEWHEAFLHPREIPGIVVQLAYAPGGGWISPPPPDFPVSGTPSALQWIGHAVPTLDQGIALFRDVLGGKEVGSGEEALVGAKWVELAWSGPGRLRLLAPTTDDSPLHGWLGGRTGRVHHLAFASPVAAEIANGRQVDDEIWEVDPDDNLGTRLLITKG